MCAGLTRGLDQPAAAAGMQPPNLLVYEWYIFDLRLVNRFGELSNGLRCPGKRFGGRPLQSVCYRLITVFYE